MNYKIVSKNTKLINQTTFILNLLDLHEAKHIQEVNLWLIDAKTMDTQSIVSYKNRQNYTNLLFITNDIEDVSKCLENSFTHYISYPFSDHELISWCKFIFRTKREKVLFLDEDNHIDFEDKSFTCKDKKVYFSRQETALLQELSSAEYVSTKNLRSALEVNSDGTIRTIINRIRKKAPNLPIKHKRDDGYKLIIKRKEQTLENKIRYDLKELEEQNELMQTIVDSSPIYIATFIHKQLHCINHSFRAFIGHEVIRELWDETKGDFFQIIKHNNEENESLKQRLFSKGKQDVEVYDFLNGGSNFFIVETFYFPNLDKHLLVFTQKLDL